jgi:DNA-binding NarL/FixJ family response regulator
VGETTVTSHVAAILAKTASSRAQAVVIAYESGLVRVGAADVALND